MPYKEVYYQPELKENEEICFLCGGEGRSKHTNYKGVKEKCFECEGLGKTICRPKCKLDGCINKVAIYPNIHTDRHEIYPHGLCNDHFSHKSRIEKEIRHNESCIEQCKTETANAMSALEELREEIKIYND